MKLHARQSISPYCEVYLDDVRQDRCTFASEERGVVIVDSGEATQERKRGRVRIVLKENCSEFVYVMYHLLRDREEEQSRKKARIAQLQEEFLARSAAHRKKL